ncbi:MAG TPA: pyridoxal kinase PdxY [Candidatus Acidoferrum sp.]|nr:pyridoxal kinase PdxY [Candidatus Acidoferrum sp.]
MNILSIQSHVAYGHVGNSAAVFPLQRLGHDVWPIHTVAFSNHLGYPTWRGRTRAPEEVAEIVDGLDQLGALKRCDAVLSGYLGDKGNGAVVLDAVARVRAANPRALYACDPVMGDRGVGLFVKPDVPAIFGEQLLPAADLCFPNAFELEFLTGGSTERLDRALAATDQLQRRMRAGAVVVLTSLLRADRPEGRIEVLAAGADAAWLIDAPYHAGPPHGAGDCFAALFLGYYLTSRSIEDALARSVSAIHLVLAASTGQAELQIIAAQDSFVLREPLFRPRRIR